MPDFNHDVMIGYMYRFVFTMMNRLRLTDTIDYLIITVQVLACILSFLIICVF